MAGERWSIREVADYLGDSRQRVDQIRRDDGTGFPEPAQDRPAHARRWDSSEIEEWAERERWGRYSRRTRP